MAGVTSGQQIVDAAQPQTSLDWLSLVLLLDQMPRNCYRGDASAVVFNLFDPLAQEVALAAFKRGIPDADPATRWLLCRRMWFYLPLEHSENLELHRLATDKFAALSRDVEALISGGTSVIDGGGDEDQLRARVAGVLAANADAARGMVKGVAAFEQSHLDIIERFGRYPHRNKALGRASTDDEIKYLAEGGQTFGGGSGGGSNSGEGSAVAAAGKPTEN